MSLFQESDKFFFTVIIVGFGRMITIEKKKQKRSLKAIKKSYKLKQRLRAIAIVIQRCKSEKYIGDN